MRLAQILLPIDLRIRNRFGGVSLIPASERRHVDHGHMRDFFHGNIMRDSVAL